MWFRTGSLELHLGVEDGFVPARKAHPGIITRDRRVAGRLADIHPCTGRHHHRELPIGRGDRPDAAIDDLRARVVALPAKRAPDRTIIDVVWVPTDLEEEDVDGWDAYR